MTFDDETIQGRVLIVDDEEGMRNYLSVVLSRDGHRTDTVPDGLAALQMCRNNDYDVVLLDLKMPRLDGLGLLEKLGQENLSPVTVVMTAYSTWESAVQAMRLGAYNYIRKPFDNEEIRTIIARSVMVSAFLRGDDRDEVEQFIVGNLIGNSPAMRAVGDLIRRIGPTDSTVCIQGESGTGKELVARAIHFNSTRRDGRFVAVNCSAFTETLLESELFGHARGAFTGAVSDKQGLFTVASGGTFFLDEIGDMSKTVQAKVLRTLEEREVKPVGATDTVKIDVRLIAATNRNLEELVSSGQFREDLFYRLNVIPLIIPPLRERKGDIPFLVGHLIGKQSRRMGKRIRSISRQGMDALLRNDWPGNVRELENTIQRAIALTRSEEITVADLEGSVSIPRDEEYPQTAALPDDGIDLARHLLAVERNYILRALERCSGRATEAAELLHMGVRSLRYRIRKLGLRDMPTEDDFQPNEAEPVLSGDEKW